MSLDRVVVHKSADGKDRHGTRERTFTEKGLAYQLETRSRRRQRAFALAEQKASAIRSRLIEEVSPQEVQLLHSHWLTLYESFIDAHNEYVDLLSSEDANTDAQNWFGPKSEQCQLFRGIMEEWFSSASERKSLVAKSQSICSRKSVRSGRSSLANSVASARLKEAQAKAEIRIKAAALQQKSEMAQAKLKLQMEEEKLQLDEQLAISDARMKVLDEFVEQQSASSACRSTLQPVPTKGLDPVAPTCLSSQEQTFPVIPSAFVNVVPNSNIDLVGPTSSDSAIMSIVKHLRKPQIEVSKFGGDPLLYRRFIRQFNARVVSNADDDDEKLAYLEQLTFGEVNKIVRSFSHMDASVAYSAVMLELEERYGDSDTIATAFVKKALSWPNIKANEYAALDQYAIFLCECENAVNSIHSMKVLEYPDNMRKLVCKLPVHLHDRWRTLVQGAKDRQECVNFHKLTSFVRQEAKKANDPIYGREAMLSEADGSNKATQRSADRMKSSHAGVANPPEGAAGDTNVLAKLGLFGTGDSSDGKLNAFSKPCLFCEDESHMLSECQEIRSKPFNDRIQFLKGRGLCFGCLKLGHQRHACRNKAACKECERRHPTIMHIDNYKHQYSDEIPGDRGTSSAAADLTAPKLKSNMGDAAGDCTFAIVPVKVRLANRVKEVYAFFDPGSNATFCTERLMREIGGNSHQKMRITVDTMGVPQRINTHLIRGLEVSDLDNNNPVVIPEVYTKDRIPATSRQIPTNADIKEWSHFDGINLPEICSPIDLLIGNNIPDAYSPFEVRTGPPGSPHACKTRLGWLIWGLVRHSDPQLISLNRAEVVAIQSKLDDQQLGYIVQRGIHMDCPEKTFEDRRNASVEDKFLSKVESSIQLNDGQHEMGLPFRDNHVEMPREATHVDQCYFVQTAANPADNVSRGLQSDISTYGPQFLWEKESEWSALPVIAIVSDSDPEVRKQVNFAIDIRQYAMDLGVFGFPSRKAEMARFGQDSQGQDTIKHIVSPCT